MLSGGKRKQRKLAARSNPRRGSPRHPPEGTAIYCDDGFITLYRNNSNFFRLEVDTTLKSVCYGRIYYEIVTYYT